MTAPGPAQTPPPNPTAAGPDGRRVLSGGGVADHEVTPQAPLTGSGWREHSYGGFGGGHQQFHLHALLEGAILVPSQQHPFRVLGLKPLVDEIGSRDGNAPKAWEDMRRSYKASR